MTNLRKLVGALARLAVVTTRYANQYRQPCCVCRTAPTAPLAKVTGGADASKEAGASRSGLAWSCFVHSIAVRVCSLSIISRPTPPSHPSHPSSSSPNTSKQAVYTDCRPVPCDCALPTNITSIGSHSLQEAPSAPLRYILATTISHLSTCALPPTKPLTCSSSPAPPPSMRSPRFQSQNTGMPISTLRGLADAKMETAAEQWRQTPTTS